ncbi:MAG: ATPase [Chloroflexi bacterium]|nr:ATPase [Chloroflexota bacterium]
MHFLNTAILGLLVTLLLASATAMRRVARPQTALRSLIGGMIGVNGLGALASAAVVFLTLSFPLPALAQGGTTVTPQSGAALGAALATGLACIGAGIAVGIAGAAAIGGIAEKPEMLGRTLIFVGLAEGIAIYGLIISFMILSR